jgi:hypothetical protein
MIIGVSDHILVVGSFQSRFSIHLSLTYSAHHCALIACVLILIASASALACNNLASLDHLAVSIVCCA